MKNDETRSGFSAVPLDIPVRAQPTATENRMTRDELTDHARNTFGYSERMTQDLLDAYNLGADAERSECAKVCRQRADKIAAEADRCAAEEPDEVSALRSAAWQLTVAENEILKRSNVELRDVPAVSSPERPA